MPAMFHSYLSDGPLRKMLCRALVLVVVAPVLGFVTYLLLGFADAQEPRPAAQSSGRPVLVRTPQEQARLVEEGRYLATIGVCGACHTPPDVPDNPPAPQDRAAVDRERRFRTDPDWFRYLDPSGRNHLAGGVPFIMRFSRDMHGVVYSRNITPDSITGIGRWTESQIVQAIRTGRRPDGTSLFLFAPHTFFRNMAEQDAVALAVYLKSVPPVRHAVLPRMLPFPTQPATSITPMVTAPRGRTPERARYLLGAVVGCGECHSHTVNGRVEEFIGGRPGDPFIGVFRLGPDLPLRQSEKGLSTWPYPGYAVLYAGNLTRFGHGGDLSHVPVDQLVMAIRQGISTVPDAYGRPRPLAHVMLWQFYSSMRDEDVYAIAEYVKSLRYVPNDVPERLTFYGDDWRGAFQATFGEAPSAADAQAFGKTPQ